MKRHQQQVEDRAEKLTTILNWCEQDPVLAAQVRASFGATAGCHGPTSPTPAPLPVTPAHLPVPSAVAPPTHSPPPVTASPVEKVIAFLRQNNHEMHQIGEIVRRTGLTRHTVYSILNTSKHQGLFVKDVRGPKDVLWGLKQDDSARKPL